MVTKQFRRDSFKAALREASNRLKEALSEREGTRVHLAELDAEIPALQQTIEALQRQLNPDSVTFQNSRNGQQTKPNGEVVVPPIPEDLRGMGAIRNGETIAVTEDTLLPEPEGTPLLPEE